MIVAERKPIEQIQEMIGDFKKVLVVGCGTCVAVCMAGGEKEVEILAEELRLWRKLNGEDGYTYDEVTLTRQCDKEYLEEIRDRIGDYDAVISTACGAGVQFLAEVYEGRLVFPALNTKFIGVAEGAGVWTQRCMACSDCILEWTGGICPMTICPKNLLNGPCGGTNHGKCEVDPDKDCAWTLIYRRLEKLGRLEKFKQIHAPKNYNPMTKPGSYVHAAYQEEGESTDGQ